MNFLNKDIFFNTLQKRLGVSNIILLFELVNDKVHHICHGICVLPKDLTNIVCEYSNTLYEVSCYVRMQDMYDSNNSQTARYDHRAFITLGLKLKQDIIFLFTMYFFPSYERGIITTFKKQQCNCVLGNEYINYKPIFDSFVKLQKRTYQRDDGYVEIINYEKTLNMICMFNHITNVINEYYVNET